MVVISNTFLEEIAMPWKELSVCEERMKFISSYASAQAVGHGNHAV